MIKPCGFYESGSQRSRWPSSSAVCIAVVLSCFCVACQRIPTQNGLLEREVTTPHVSAQQLRVLVNEYVVFSAHRLELCADKVLAENPDVAVRKSALMWKINGIAASFQAASRHDPLGAYLDLWVLNRQMLHLFESPKGLELFGSWQPIVTAECHSLDERLLGISQLVSSDLRLGEQFVEKFAIDFPLNGLYFDREPIASRYIAEVQTPSQELFQVVASLDSNIDELRKLTVLYAEHLPKQARWEAELFLLDTTQLTVLQRPLHDLSLGVEAVARIADTTQSLPKIVASERQALTALVTKERQDTMLELDAMRSATMSQIGVERSLILAAIRTEREASFVSLREERLAVAKDVHAEISRAIQATDTITSRRGSELIQQAPKVIDHFFWRAWQICLVFAFLGTILGWGLMRASSQMRNTQPTQENFISVAPPTLAMRTAIRRNRAA